MSESKIKLHKIKSVEEYEKILGKPREVDYTGFKNGADLLAALGDDGLKWATAFCQHAKKNLKVDVDVYFALGWFANVIESTHQLRENQRLALEKDKERFTEEGGDSA